MRWCRWCPNGCGKCVLTLMANPRKNSNYQCKRCNQIFKLEDLAVINNIKNVTKRRKQRIIKRGNKNGKA